MIAIEVVLEPAEGSA